jgi:tRNA(Ile)-lysidine synthase
MAEPRRLTTLAAAALDRIATMPPGPAAVALSGGADSAACAWVLGRAGRDVRALHVHHGLPDSDRMATAAVAVADRLGLDLEVLEVRPPQGPSFEGRARQARYRALLDAVEPDELLATGHTLDDQAETVLMNLMRGSGLDGLAGIPVIRLPVVRPVIDLARGETRELATLARLPWRDDPANQDPAHLRNRIRRDVLPVLHRTFNPGIGAALARTAGTAAAEVAELDRLAARVPAAVAGGEVRMPVGALLAVSPPVAARAVRRALARIGLEHPPTTAQLDRILDVVEFGGEAPVSHGLVARRRGPSLVVGEPAEAVLPEAVEVEPPASVDWGKFTLVFTVGERPAVLPLSARRMVHPMGSGTGVVVVRRSRAGDRIGGKRVSDAIAEAAVPAPDRPGWPVVEVDGAVVWVPGVRRAGSPRRDGDRYLCGVATEDTRWERSAP